MQTDVSLQDLNSFHVAARAASFARVTSVDALQRLRDHPAWAAGPRLILGGGSNILLTRDFDGLVVQLALQGRSLADEDGEAWYPRIAAGENWDETVYWTLRSGWPGLENLVSIPGTTGAAPIQNIGAYGVELRERFHSLEAMDVQTGEILRMNADQCEFGYRDSIFKRQQKDRLIITAVTLRLPKRWRPALDYGDVRAHLDAQGITDPNALQVAETIAGIRAAKLPDPDVLGNAGSFFKNPIITAAQHAQLLERFPDMVGYVQRDGGAKLAAAWLIEQCGWKGRAIGAAAVHDRQALVLVNRGGATGAEIRDLATAVAASVRDKFGVVLETEPVVV